MSECKHCKFIHNLFGKIFADENASHRDYYMMTEVFTYLHGSDVRENKPDAVYTLKDLTDLQSRVFKITGKGEVMQEFNRLLGVNG